MTHKYVIRTPFGRARLSLPNGKVITISSLPNEPLIANDENFELHYAHFDWNGEWVPRLDGRGNSMTTLSINGHCYGPMGQATRISQKTIRLLWETLQPIVRAWTDEYPGELATAQYESLIEQQRRIREDIRMAETELANLYEQWNAISEDVATEGKRLAHLYKQREQVKPAPQRDDKEDRLPLSPARPGEEQ